MDKPLFWHQGLFLQPQHLQLKDKYDSQQFTPYHLHIKPHLNGVVHMDIVESSISNCSFGISRGAFWLPDMTYAVLGKNALIESRDFRANLASSGSMMVYVGLKKWLDERPNVTEIPGGSSSRIVDTRFLILKDQEEVPDLHQGGNPAPVQRMYLALRLFFENELPHVASYDLIPVARIEWRENAFNLAKDYIPPSVSADADATLSGKVKAVGDMVIGASMELSAYKRKRGIHNAEFGSRDMVYLLVLISLNRYAPYFQQLQTEKFSRHPHDIYSVIAQLVGELSSFSDRVSALGSAGETADDEKTKNSTASEPDRLPAYNHLDLWTCFTHAEYLVKDLIEEITTGPDHVLDIVFTDPYYTCPLSDDLFKGDNLYYLVMRTAADPGTVVNAIDTGIKVTSPSLMTMIVERSLPGALVEYLPVPPQELPRRTHGIYFRLDKNGEAFRHIRKERQLALFWYEPPKDLKMELMVVKEN